MSQQTPLRYSVLLNSQGAEEHARGNQVWYWNYSFHPLDQEVPEGYLKVGEFSPEHPDADQARRIALAKLEARRREIYAEAEVEARKIAERIQNLLALPAPTQP